MVTEAQQLTDVTALRYVYDNGSPVTNWRGKQEEAITSGNKVSYSGRRHAEVGRNKTLIIQHHHPKRKTRRPKDSALRGDSRLECWKPIPVANWDGMCTNLPQPEADDTGEARTWDEKSVWLYIDPSLREPPENTVKLWLPRTLGYNTVCIGNNAGMMYSRGNKDVWRTYAFQGTQCSDASIRNKSKNKPHPEILKIIPSCDWDRCQ